MVVMVTDFGGVDHSLARPNRLCEQRGAERRVGWYWLQSTDDVWKLRHLIGSQKASVGTGICDQLVPLVEGLSQLQAAAQVQAQVACKFRVQNM